MRTRGEDSSGARVDELAGDASFVLDALLDPARELGALAGRIEASQVGILGHSLGGAAALEAGRIDVRFRASADMDGHPFGTARERGLARPYLVLLNQPEKSKRPPPEMGRERHSVWETLAEKQRSPVYLTTIENTNHFTFSDAPFLVPAARMARSGAVLAPERGREILSRLLRAYFAERFGLAAAESLEDAAKAYPEVTFEILGG